MLELKYVSPKLLAIRDIELAVPGTYLPHSPLICIHSFDSNLHVISSKQRPRRISIQGNDGVTYTFLLKGHEDLRQDERVMQLFGLVNTLLANDQHTHRSQLNIRTYSGNFIPSSS